MLSIIGLVLDTGIEKNTQIFFDTFDTFDTGIEKNTQIGIESESIPNLQPRVRPRPIWGTSKVLN